MNTLTALFKNKRGFTLIELLVVISIIGVMASTLLFILRPAVFFGQGRDARRQSDLQTVRAAMAQYYLDNGRLYPNTSGGSAAARYTDLETYLVDYLDSFPTDPGSTNYEYQYSGDQKCYELRADMEQTTPDPFKVCGGSLSCQSANSFCN